MGKGQESQVARSASVEVRYVPQFDDTAHAAQGRTSRLSSRDALRRVTRDFTETWSFGRGVRPHRSGSFHRDQPPRGQGLGSVVGLGAAADPGCEAGHADADDARPAGSSTGSRSTDLVRSRHPAASAAGGRHASMSPIREAPARTGTAAFAARGGKTSSNRGVGSPRRRWSGPRGQLPRPTTSATPSTRSAPVDRSRRRSRRRVSAQNQM